MNVQETVTLAIAVGGLLLGIRSEWREHTRGKVRLRVVPKVAFPFGPMPDYQPCIAFEIINEGHVPVSVTEVGFFFDGTQSRASLAPILQPGQSWPHRLEPHSSIVVFSSADALEDVVLSKVVCAYALTATDKVFEGSSAALQRVVKDGRIPALNRVMARTGEPGYHTVTSFDDS